MKKIILLMAFLIVCNFLFANDYRTGDHELFLMPTAYTIPKGKSFLADYELIFLNYSISPEAGSQIGFYSLFPVTSDFLNSFVLQAKQKLIKYKRFQSAAIIGFAPKPMGYGIGNAVSLDFDNKSLHLGVAGVGEFEDDEIEAIYMAGGSIDVGEATSLILEYINTHTLIENDFGGMIAFGFRFRGKKINWELGAMRTLGVMPDFLIAYPLVKATVFFGK
ncbi:MAG: hypothetical protein KGY75_08090 [Candidatus Cloacimonetes bacterium]|nr:hypothetical protein [Candidatus Cloacimonadota bacterium]MBS3768061.1 hypothetical protein [Candidatus Cloacimonadota bacterium]